MCAVRQAAVLREPGQARLVLRLEPGRLTVESSQVGAGRVAAELAVEYAGGPRTAAFNPEYLLDLLRALEGEPTVRLELGEPGPPAPFAAPGYRPLPIALGPQAVL